MAKNTNVKPITVCLAAGRPADLTAFGINKIGNRADWFGDDKVFSAQDKMKAINCINKADQMIGALGGSEATRRNAFISVWVRFHRSGVVDTKRMKRALEQSDGVNWKLNNLDLARKLVQVYNYKKRAPFLDVIVGSRGDFKIAESNQNHWRNV